MKKNIFTIALLSLSVLLIFTNCDKDDDEVASDPMTTATIKGLVEANLNLTNDTNDAGLPETQWEIAPAGTKVIAVINSAFLVTNPDPAVTYQFLTYETTVDANGMYTFTVDAITKSANYTLKFDDFEYDQKLSATVVERKVYTVADQAASVVKNETVIQDVIYN